MQITQHFPAPLTPPQPIRRLQLAKPVYAPDDPRTFDFIAAGTDAINESRVRGETASDQFARRYVGGGR